MVQRFKETGHPVFTSASVLSREILRRLKGKTIHFIADASNTEFFFRIVTQRISSVSMEQSQTGVDSSI